MRYQVLISRDRGERPDSEWENREDAERRLAFLKEVRGQRWACIREAGGAAPVVTITCIEE